ncbi:MAG: hypothetical protein CVU39_23185 [Chloroflexi bacterium HGW-Chloroflexi-10]|nr:MAG: hypothetical protein CVU39_23185 [Chloroflexi bacterium HGW-Chloroflexi-10]
MKSSRHLSYFNRSLKKAGVWAALVGVALLMACSFSMDDKTVITPSEPSIQQVLPSLMPTVTRTLTPTVTVTPSPVPSPEPTVCGKAHGEIRKVLLYSEILGQDVPVNVYLPPCYDPGMQGGYPLLVLLHGQGSNEQHWIELGLTTAADDLISTHQIPPVVIVMPQERDHRMDSKLSPFVDVLVVDLLPQWQSLFNVHDERQFMAIGGISRGANWAVRIAFTRPLIFGIVGGHSFTTFASDMRLLPEWLEQISISDLPRLGFDVGEHDYYFKYSDPFVQELQARDIPLTYVVQPGWHSPEYWAEHVVDYLLWYTQDW